MAEERRKTPRSRAGSDEVIRQRLADMIILQS